MKRLLIIVMVSCLLSPISFAADNDVAPNVKHDLDSSCVSPIAPFSMGEINWSLDVGTPCSEGQCLGVEFDGTNYWITGAASTGGITYLYEVTPAGVLVNSYPQPAGNWSGWGWRDLAWDGNYLYAGDPNSTGNIQQIDPLTGSVTGVSYGNFGSVLCRALAWDKTTDRFWTGSFSGDIYECDRLGTFITHSNPGLSIYGAAIEEEQGVSMIWWWSQDGVADVTATQMNTAGLPTGLAFEGVAPNGMAGGACANEIGGGVWEFIGLSQDSDNITAYDLYPIVDSLEVDTKNIQSWKGGTVNFSLDAGIANASREYLLLGSISYVPGVSPGIPLKAGAVLPLSWDMFTSLLLNMNMPAGHYGFLNSSSTASATLVLPIFDPPFSFDMTFAYCLRKTGGLNFASDYVQVHIEDWTQPTLYKYDDGVSNSLMCLTAGGELCWINGFDSGPVGDNIEYISNTYGRPGSTAGPGNGHPTTLFIWDDPTNDGEPSDAALLDMVQSTIQQENTDIFVDTLLNTVQPVTGYFFIGVMMDHLGSTITPTQFVAPYDTNNIHPTCIWSIGDPGNAAGGFDYTTLSNNSYFSHKTDRVWMVRAIPQ